MIHSVVSTSRVFRFLSAISLGWLLLCSGSSAQTKAETVEFVAGKIGSLRMPAELVPFDKVEGGKLELATMFTEYIGGKKLVRELDFIEWKKVTSIVVTTQEEPLAYVITFSGDLARSTIDGDPDLPRTQEFFPVQSIRLHCKFEKKEVDRLVKGMKHLCILNGAKLVGDDLFK